jgi:hypothetical protein
MRVPLRGGSRSPRAATLRRRGLTQLAEPEAVSGDRTRPPPAHSPPSLSYRGIFTIEVGANGAVEMPPSLLAVSVHTSGWPASALVTLYVRA